MLIISLARWNIVARKWLKLLQIEKEGQVTLPYTCNYDHICRHNHKDLYYLSVHRSHRLVLSFHLPLSGPCQFFLKSPSFFLPPIHLFPSQFYRFFHFFPFNFSISLIVFCFSITHWQFRLSFYFFFLIDRIR